MSKPNKYTPHYGNKAAERNIRHAKNYTHGLWWFGNKVNFCN